MSRRGRNRFFLSGLACALAAVSAASPVAGTDLTAEVRRDAARLQAVLDRIADEPADGAPRSMRAVTFTERELNSWLAVLLEAGGNGVLRELALKLFDDNRVEGRAFVDLSGARLPLGLKPRMNIFFSGEVTVADRAARIDLDGLFFEGQAVPVVLLDAVIAAAAALGSSAAGSIRDWVALPPGLRSLRGRKGNLILYY